MDANQYKLLQEVLLRLDRFKVLDDLVLVGGWCVYFYREYYFKKSFISPFRTPDLDFLVPYPDRLQSQADIPGLLEDLGFVQDFRGEQGYLQLSHPDLRIEFLVHEKGRGLAGPVALKAWKMNAQPLRFMDMLLSRTVELKVDRVRIRVPHPACFSFQKLIISSRRTGRSAHKAENDRKAAIEVLGELMRKKDEEWMIKDVFSKLGQKQQKQILDMLGHGGAEDICSFLGTDNGKT